MWTGRGGGANQRLFHHIDDNAFINKSWRIWGWHRRKGHSFVNLSVLPTLGRTSRPVRWKYSAAEEKSKLPDKSATNFGRIFPVRDWKGPISSTLLLPLLFPNKWFDHERSLTWIFFYLSLILVKLFQKLPFYKGYFFFSAANLIATLVGLSWEEF